MLTVANLEEICVCFQTNLSLVKNGISGNPLVCRASP
jgi:hypothetical protein